MAFDTGYIPRVEWWLSLLLTLVAVQGNVNDLFILSTEIAFHHTCRFMKTSTPRLLFFAPICRLDLSLDEH
jgi:hypothetical protein